MKTLRTLFHLRLAFAALLLTTVIPHLSTAHAQGTAFTYQGQLSDGSNPATGSYDLEFSLWSAASGPAQVGSTFTRAATPVSDGVFTVTLDFGNQFPGADRWLEIAVRTNGGGAFSTLSPRQAIRPTPYAIYSANAGSAATAATATTAGSATSVAATNITGTVADTALSANVALLSRPVQSFTGGTNSFSGRIGIGTTTPAWPLDVNGSMHVGSHAADGTPKLIRFGDADYVSIGENTEDDRMELTATRFVFNNGTVGIGTTSSAVRLHVYGSENPTVMRLQSSGGFGSGKLEFWSDPQGAANEWRPASIRSVDNGGFTGGLSFLVNGTGPGNKTNEVEVMRIVNGNVGIGTNNPTARLDVVGTLKATAFAGSGSGLTGINASEMTSGAVPDARLSANVSLLGSSIESGEITDGQIVNADISPTAAIADTKLGTIVTAGKVADSALSGNVALRNANNVFNGSQLINNGDFAILKTGSGTVGPTLALRNTASAALNNAVAIDLNVSGSAAPATAQILAADEGGFSAGIRFSTKNPGNATNALVERMRINSTGDLAINNNDLLLRNGSDTTHGLGYYGTTSTNKPFAGVNMDGPVLYGFSRGGLGTKAGGERLILTWDPSGTVKLGTSAQYFAPAAEENVRIVRGVIQNTAVTAISTTGALVAGPGQSLAGVTVYGPGYAVTRIAAGRYTVAFTPAFTSIPAITANAANVAPNDALTYFCDIGDLTVNSCEVRTGISGSGNYDLGFTFIAIGPR